MTPDHPTDHPTGHPTGHPSPDPFEDALTARLQQRAAEVDPQTRPVPWIERRSRRRRTRRHAVVAGLTAVLIAGSALTVLTVAAAVEHRPLPVATDGSTPATAHPGTLVAPAPDEHAGYIEGERLWRANCAACHGPAGEGGAGPRVADGEVLLTFPDRDAEIAYVRGGDQAIGNGRYGDPDRPGGQHGGGYNGAFMPAFPTLTDAELLALVRYEREVLSGETPT